MRVDVRLAVGTIEETINLGGSGTPQVQASPGLPRRLRIGGNTQAAKVRRMVRPAYPQHMKDAGITGTVIM